MQKWRSRGTGIGRSEHYSDTRIWLGRTGKNVAWTQSPRPVARRVHERVHVKYHVTVGTASVECKDCILRNCEKMRTRYSRRRCTRLCNFERVGTLKGWDEASERSCQNLSHVRADPGVDLDALQVQAPAGSCAGRVDRHVAE